ncbi:MAG: hypothetical protein WCK86_15080, partial [Planctomycetia bacterium]
ISANDIRQRYPPTISANELKPARNLTRRSIHSIINTVHSITVTQPNLHSTTCQESRAAPVANAAEISSDVHLNTISSRHSWSRNPWGAF